MPKSSKRYKTRLFTKLIRKKVGRLLNISVRKNTIIGNPGYLLRKCWTVHIWPKNTPKYNAHILTSFEERDFMNDVREFIKQCPELIS